MNLLKFLIMSLRWIIKLVSKVMYIKGVVRAGHLLFGLWRIPGAGEPGGLLSVGSHRGGHD